MLVTILKKALSGTFKWQWEPFVGVFFGSSIAWGYLYHTEGKQVAFEEVPFLIATIVGGAGSLFTIFLWNLICAPYRLERDAHNETKEKLLQASYGHQKLSLQDFISSRDSFTVKEAACILVGQPITSGELLGVAAGKSTDIKRKLIKGDIAAASDISLQIDLAHLKSDVPYQSLTPNSPEAEFLNEVEISKETLTELGFKPEDH